VDVIKSTKADMPKEYKWSKSGNDIMVKEDDSGELKKKIFENMLTSLKFDSMGEKTIGLLYDNNYNTLKKLYNISIEDIIKLKGFKQKSAENLFNSINKRNKLITCIEYMVASKCFDEGLGFKTLQKITDIYGDKEASLQELVEINDVGESRAKIYIDGLINFKKFKIENELNCIAKKEETKTISDKYKDQYIVFTGFRNGKLEEYIKSNGGNVQSSLNKKTTILIYKDLEKSSKKISDAKKNNKIRVIQLDDFDKVK
jgi:DNA ligase (NAD+)